MIKMMFIAGIGGFIGTCLRYLVGKAACFLFSNPFPYGTFIVNVLGCFLIGIFFGLAEKTNLLSSNMMIFLITGFCGSFTTFSTFSDDMYLLLQGRHFGIFSIYIIVSLLAGLAMVWLGRSIVKPV